MNESTMCICSAPIESDWRVLLILAQKIHSRSFIPIPSPMIMKSKLSTNSSGLCPSIPLCRSMLAYWMTADQYLPHHGYKRNCME